MSNQVRFEVKISGNFVAESKPKFNPTSKRTPRVTSADVAYLGPRR